VIDAMQWTGDNFEAIWPLNVEGNGCTLEANYEGPIPRLSIETLEGTMEADIGDWIIRGVKGELYPCKPDIFAATYEPAD
jgi:hypothetical protein